MLEFFLSFEKEEVLGFCLLAMGVLGVPATFGRCPVDSGTVYLINW